jgi:hypothetical protein
MSKEEIGHSVYGFEKRKEINITMCGGCREWWNYVIRFDKDGDFDLYREDCDGLHHIDRNPVILFNPETEKLLTGEDKYEGIINRDGWVLVDYNFYEEYI